MRCPVKRAVAVERSDASFAGCLVLATRKRLPTCEWRGPEPPADDSYQCVLSLVSDRTPSYPVLCLLGHAFGVMSGGSGPPNVSQVRRFKAGPGVQEL